MPITFTPLSLTNIAQIGANQSAVQTASLGNGGYVVAWESDFGGSKNVFFQRFDGAGRATGGTAQIVNTMGQSMLLRDIAVTSDGSFSILTQDAFYSASVPPRLYVNSFFEGTGAPTAVPTVLNLDTIALSAIGAQLVADPDTSPSSLVVVATVYDSSFFTDLVRAKVTTAGAITVAPSVVTNNYPTATGIIELAPGLNGQQFALTSGGIVDTVGGTLAFATASDMIQLSPGVLLVARPAGPSPMVTLTMFTGASTSVLAYVASASVIGTTTTETQSVGSQVFDTELLNLGNGRVLIIWVGDGGDTVPASSTPFIDGVLAQVYNLYSGAAEGTPVRIKELGLGSNDALLQAVTLSSDLMADGRVVVSMSYNNGLNGSDVFTSILDPRITGITVTAKSAGVEVFVGTAFDDTFTAINNDDQVFGGNGNDTAVFAGNNARFIDLQTPAVFPAETVILSGIENLTGSSLADDLRGDAVANILNGATGDDTLSGRDNADTLIGEGGNDLVFGGLLGDQIDGGVGLDTLIGGDGADLIFGGVDVDLLYGGTGDDTISGGDADDRLIGQAGNDMLAGDAGADLLNGWLGDDQLSGGAGNDTLRSDVGADSLFGGLDSDVLLVSNDVALVDGGAGLDTLKVGADFIQGTGGFFVDLTGVFDLLGLANTYTRFAPEISSIETVAGSLGDDLLVGNATANLLRGGGGNDVLFGGLGIDTLVGGVGADVFVFQNAAAGSADIIRDFRIADDSIGLVDGAFGDINADNIGSRLTINATGTVGATNVAQLIFDNAGAGFGQMFFDADGNGAGVAVLLATLSPTTGTLLAITATDFVFI